jgi:hypothetical protein
VWVAAAGGWVVVVTVVPDPLDAVLSSSEALVDGELVAVEPVVPELVEVVAVEVVAVAAACDVAAVTATTPVPTTAAAPRPTLTSRTPWRAESRRAARARTCCGVTRAGCSSSCGSGIRCIGRLLS